MISRIDIATKGSDGRARVKEKSFSTLIGRPVAVTIINSYLIDASLDARNLPKVAAILTNPVLEEAYVNTNPLKNKFSYAIEIGFLPGVTDNVATTVRETIEDALKRKFKKTDGVYTSMVFVITGTLSQADAEKIASTLYNPLIERASIISFQQFSKTKKFPTHVAKVELHDKATADTVDLSVPDAELVRIGKEGVLNVDGSRRGPLALGLTEMKVIQAYFQKQKRSPTDIELESLAQTWSEHCKHTIFASPLDEIKDGLYKTYIKGATNQIRKKKGKRDFCVSVFSDNSGAIGFDENYLITHKVETHNSPSALDPFGGAITGIVGVNRDAMGFGLGAKPVANTYGFCFAMPTDTRPLYRDSALTQKMLPPARIMEGVIKGINAGGNCSGIPTPEGFVFFDERYRGKPLVFAGTVGLIPRKIKGKRSDIKKAKAGDLIVMVGGRVGADGIHGATFSSVEMDSGSPATAVQIGDPITEKKFSDALVKEARDQELYHSITDNGAGGLSCSVAEMAKECGGAIVDLEKVPLKYPGLAPWAIWISESQERMTLAVPKNKWKAFKALMERRGVEATAIGTFTGSGRCIVRYQKKKIMDIPLSFLHDGLPLKHLVSRQEKKIHLEPPKQNNSSLSSVLTEMLTRPNIASRAFIASQYDHEVQSGSVIKPLVGAGRVDNDGGVIKPVLSSNRGAVLSHGIVPVYSDIDTYHMAAAAIDTAVRNAVALGASLDYLAILDNTCWCSSDDPVRLYELKQAIKACYDYALIYDTPYISGKDSMFNDFKGYDEKGMAIKISIPPTLLISSIGVMKDVRKAITLDPKMPGDLVYLLGETHDELGASEYFALISDTNKKKYVGNTVPRVDGKRNKKLYQSFEKAGASGMIASAISIGRGGLGVALSKMAIASGHGVEINLKGLPGKVSQDDFALFSESQGRIVVTIDPKNKKKFEGLFAGEAIKLIGKVRTDKEVNIQGLTSKVIVESDAATLDRAYKKTFKNY